VSALTSGRGQWTVFVFFLGSCFIFGGGARADITSLLILRPLSWLVVGYAWAIAIASDRPFRRMPLVLVLAMCALLILQLIPLPHALWTHLPGRRLVAMINSDVGLQNNWRPLSLSPSRTANSLFAMGVPIGTALLLANLGAKRIYSVVWALRAAGAASAVLGLLQILGPEQGPLYTYRIANFGTPTGLFANRNHQAVFLASVLPLLAYAFFELRSQANNPRRPLLLAFLVAEGVLCLAIILATGSRSGTALAFAVTLVLLTVWYLADRSGRPSARSPLRRLTIPAAVLALVALSVLMFANSRAPGVHRVFQESLADELRVQVLPVVWGMAKSYFPAGSGFGTFYLVYNIAEPHNLLQSSYLNQAHNDLLQVVVEGGAGALLLLGAALIWFLRSGWQSWTAFRAAVRMGRTIPLGPFAWLSLAVLLAASVVDYPIRTPALMSVAVILASLLSTVQPDVPARTRPTELAKGL
jgi:hypothetical protein